MVEIDLFHGGPYVPFYLTTEEFYYQVKHTLTKNGVQIVNVYNPNDDLSEYALRSMNTIAKVYPSVFSVRQGDNLIVFAFNTQKKLEEIKMKLKFVNEEFAGLASDMSEGLKEFVFRPDMPALTDDKAPVERLVYQMIHQ